MDEIKMILESFDFDWVAYEEVYVQELMLIEWEARKYITDAIELEEKLCLLENENKKEDKLISINQKEINDLKIQLVK